MTAAHLGSFRALPERVIVTVHDPDQHPEAWDTYLSGVHDCYDGFGAAHLVRRDVVLAQPCRMFWLIRSEHGEVIGGARAVGPVWRAEDIEQIPAVQELGSSPSAPEIRSQLADLADRGLVEAKGGWSAPGVRGLGPLLGRFLWHCSWWFGAGTTVATSGVEANIDRWRTAGCEPLPGIEPAPDVPVPGHHTIPLVLAADRLSTAPPPEVRRQLVAEWGYLHPARNRAAGLETTGLEVTPEVDPTRWEYRTTAPVDRTPDLRREYREATFGQEATPGPWVRLPWRGETVRVLEPTDFHRLRTDRNRHKLTDDDLATLRTKRVGVVGLSVGHAIAYTLAQEGLCGQLRLADPDHLELSNLNRLPASITDLGRSKTAIIGRRIAEIDPFLDVRLYDEGVLAESLDRFLDGLDLVIEECDSLDVKLALRTAAAARGIPVVMETNDRGMLDVERFDLEPGRPPFHGLLGELDPAELGGLSQSDKVPAVLGIVEADKLSAVMAASMVEIDQSIASWPQLAADVHLGAALVATAARNILLGRWSRSGRVRIDLDRLDADLVEPAPDPPGRTPPPIIHRRAELPARFEEAITVAAGYAPSGGNAQPWTFELTADSFVVRAVAPGVGMDIKGRGTAVACGAAALNAAIVAADHHRHDGGTAPADLATTTIDLDRGALAVTIPLGDRRYPELAELAPLITKRVTNRRADRRPNPIDDAVVDCLAAVAEPWQATVHHLAGERLAALAPAWAEADRLRFLDPRLHREMFGELRRPGRDPLADGLDERTMEWDRSDLAKLAILRRADVADRLRAWDAGHQVGRQTATHLQAAAGLMIVTVAGSGPDDYVRGGMALQRVWLEATRLRLGLQPMSPVFGYAQSRRELTELLGDRAGAALDEHRRQVDELIGLGADDRFILALRVHRAGPPSAISDRRPDRQPINLEPLPLVERQPAT